MTDTEIKVAVIKAVRGDAINLEGKSADYIEAAFDMAKADIKQHEDGMAEQRKATQSHDDEAQNNDEGDSPEEAYAKLIEAERHMYEKGRE
jgi:predicted Zn-dependent protease